MLVNLLIIHLMPFFYTPVIRLHFISVNPNGVKQLAVSRGEVEVFLLLLLTYIC